MFAEDWSVLLYGALGSANRAQTVEFSTQLRSSFPGLRLDPLISLLRYLRESDSGGLLARSESGWRWGKTAAVAEPWLELSGF
jgi:hypothetical protein